MEKYQKHSHVARNTATAAKMRYCNFEELGPQTLFLSDRVTDELMVSVFNSLMHKHCIINIHIKLFERDRMLWSLIQEPLEEIPQPVTRIVLTVHEFKPTVVNGVHKLKWYEFKTQDSHTKWGNVCGILLE